MKEIKENILLEFFYEKEDKMNLKVNVDFILYEIEPMSEMGK